MDGFEQRMNIPHNRAMAEVLANIGKLGIGAVGVGAGIRGLQGIGELVSGTMQPPPKVPIRHQFIDVPIRRPARPPEEETPLRSLAKAAEIMLPPPSPAVNAAGRVHDFFGSFSPNMSAMGKALVNPTATHWYQHPWAIPAAVGAVGGGLALGHTLTGKALDASKANEDDSELEAARRRYEQALGAHPGKMAGAAIDGVGEVLDRIYDAITPGMDKAAAAIADAMGPVLGTGAAFLGGTALLSGLASYNWARSRSEDNVVAKAMKERRDQLYRQSPPVLIAIPRPESASRRKAEGAKAAASATPMPGAVTNQTLSRLRAAQEAHRQRALLALGQPPPKPEAKPAEAAPQGPPSISRSFANK